MASDWEIHLEGNLGYKHPNVYQAYLYEAYLIASVRVGYLNSFSKAGAVLRELIVVSGLK